MPTKSQDDAAAPIKRLTAAAAAKPAVVVDDDAPICSPDDPRLDPAAAKSWRASIARQIERERAEARARAIDRQGCRRAGGR